MIVVLDSNAIIRDYRLAGRAAQRLLSQAHAEEVVLLVPEVAVLEATKHFRSDLQKAASALEKADVLARKVLTNHEARGPIDIEEKVEEYEQELRATLQDASALVISPDISHSDVMRRAVGRHPPFKPSGAGYQDALVWELAKEQAAHDDVALISDNHKDFGGGEEGGLHEALLKELLAVGPGAEVERYPTISAFNRMHLEHAAAFERELALRLDQDDDYLFEVKDTFRRVLEEGPSGALRGYGAIADETNTTVYSVQVDEVELLYVNEAGKGEYFASFQLLGTAELEFPMLQSEAWGDYEIGLLDNFSVDDPDEAFGTATSSVSFVATAEADYHPDTGELTNIEISSAEIGRRA